MDKQRQSDLGRPFRQAEGYRRCAEPDCFEEGRYRAPLSPQRLGEYQWLCLDHVRAFNAAWNAQAGLGTAEIDALRRSDAVWRRPSWPFGNARKRTARGPEDFADPFGFFAGGGRPDRETKRPSEVENALAELGLGCEATLECVKSRYKELVKKLHPDANGHDRKAEERLKAVNRAYATLKSSFTE